MLLTFSRISKQRERQILLLMAPLVALRSTPGVLVVFAAQRPYLLLEVECLSSQSQSGIHTGYAWAWAIVNPDNKAEIFGPGVAICGPTTRNIAEAASANVLTMEHDLFVPLLENAKSAPNPSP